MTTIAASSGTGRRYRRPIILSLSAAILAELWIFLVFGVHLFPTGDLMAKFLWTVIFCGIGMGAALGVAISLFVLDRLDGWRAILATAAFSGGLLGIGCDLFCFRLDVTYFDYFGANENPALFLGTGLFLSVIGGLLVGWLLFSERDDRMLARLETWT